MAKAPFFIVGSARSGTTLLRLMLNAHPDVAVPPESRFIVELWAGSVTVEVAAFLRSLDAHPRFETWDLPISAVRDELGDRSQVSYADAISAAFGAYARVHGKNRWGDKTPRYVEHIPLLAKLWSNARFIHLIRDGRDVALSYADVPFGPKTVGRAARLWARRVKAGCDAGRALPKGLYLEVNYEDLVDDAEGEIKDICDFLELDFDPGMLDYTERARGSVLPRASMYNPNVVKPPSKTRSWRETMRPGQVAAFEAVAGDVLSALGYERAYEQPDLRARMIGRLGDVGLPLGRLKGSRR
ncbi:MAG TPA: sulfotransferase [Actinomycetota bacterium]|nr:sulfotransferase [Actinomycetota bacterium]